MSPIIAIHAPFHHQAEDLGRFNAFYDEIERRELEARRVEVTGPAENAD